MKLSRNLDVKCPMCGEVNKLGEWSDGAFARCVNREMKRAFKPLTDSKSFEVSSDLYYVCPKCSSWVGGYALKIVNTEDKFLLSLGGKPNMRISRSN